MDRVRQPRVVSGATPFETLRTGVELKDIRFSYTGSDDVLRDTAFVIEKGKMTAVVGASGAGKSTMVDLLLRHYDPIQGNILVDGVDLKKLDLETCC